MFIRSFASGSSGNCTLVSAGGKSILIDAGISFSRIKNCLTQNSISLNDISAVLITHEHSDHIAALPMLEKYTDIPFITSGGTARSMLEKKKISEKNLRYAEPGDTIDFEGLKVTAFETPHDSAQSMCFTFQYENEKAAAATDLGCITDAVRSAVKDASIILLEANHDVNMLRNGPYPYLLQKRILGNFGHLSNEACGEFAAELARNGVKHIMLAHLSRENNTPALAYKTVADKLLASGIAAGSLKLTVAPADEMSCIMET